MVTILDLNSGNIGSVQNMLHRLEVETSVTNSANALAKASRIIIPGVGVFGDATRKLDVIKGLRSTLKNLSQQRRVPILGICLGMQLLFEKSEEGEGAGLGLIEGEVNRIPASGLKVPHMGWNNLEITKEDPLFNNFDQRSRFYFVHSFAKE